jgi:hypothetical protein
MTPQFRTYEFVITREEAEKLCADGNNPEIRSHLDSMYNSKTPSYEAFLCVFVYSAERISPEQVQLVPVSTSVLPCPKRQFKRLYCVNVFEIQADPEDIRVLTFEEHFRSRREQLFRFLRQQRVPYQPSPAPQPPPTFLVRDVLEQEKKLGPVLVSGGR